MPPLVSILLPTRNRPEFLELAIETVRRQDDPDWEIVVSDNASEQDVAGLVGRIEDPRIRYVRTASFVPVTENWNFALQHSTGRHVLMLGDDDGLAPGYVKRLRALSERFDEPDVVYSSAWLFAYPDVIPSEPAGYVQSEGYAEFLRGRDQPFVLDRAVARKMVDHAMHFRLRYGFNMQFSTISRRLVDELAPRGPFFQSAFPDYYATNVAFLTARRIVVEPRPLVLIGVTPKSYGFFHANAREEAGRAFLGMTGDDAARERLARAMLPGSNINAGWISAAESIWARYRDLAPAPPDHRRFRLLQIAHVYEGRYLHGTVSAEQTAELESHLRPWERRLGRSLGRAAAAGRRALPRKLRGACAHIFHTYLLRQFPHWAPPRLRGRHRTLLDVFEDPPGP